MADSKRGKSEPQDPATIDWISSLPDCLLCHILSFLPTKTSVATSILSHRWRHVWKHLQVFDFDDGCRDHYYEASLFERFAAFVNRVLALRTAPDIRKFRLSCSFLVDDDSSADSVIEWVEAATGPHLEELQLSLHPDGWGFLLPSSVFTCEALVSLSLDGVMLVEVDRPPSSLRLPSLKILKLDDVEVDSINDFLSGCGCPALETLDLHFEGALRSPEICVVASSLKSLTFADETDLEIEELEIDTPSLEYLNITLMPSCSRFSVRNLHNVVEAHLHFYAEEEEVEYIDFVLKLLRALCGTKFLVLRTSTVECLLRAPILDFPEFGCLLRLQLFLPNFNSSFLVNVLQKCRLLQVLTIHMDEEQEASLLQSWTEPTSVPSCLVSHLTIIEFRGYEGFADELAFTAYILQRALVLKTMTIHTDSSLDIEEKHDILKELSVIPRGSNLCQLYFD